MDTCLAGDGLYQSQHVLVAMVQFRIEQRSVLLLPSPLLLQGIRLAGDDVPEITPDELGYGTVIVRPGNGATLDEFAPSLEACSWRQSFAQGAGDRLLARLSCPFDLV